MMETGPLCPFLGQSSHVLCCLIGLQPYIYIVRRRLSVTSARLDVSFAFLPQVSDSYKLMVLLPNLRIYNGKDVSTTANHLRYVYSDNLRTRVRN